MLRSREKISIGKAGRKRDCGGGFLLSFIVIRVLMRNRRDAKKIRALNIRKDHGPRRNAEGKIVQ